MRDLELNELQFVSGAGCSPTPPSGHGCSPTPPSCPSRGKKRKGNNGFGNGGNDGSPNGKQDMTR